MTRTRKLKLRKESLRRLNGTELAGVDGGGNSHKCAVDDGYYGFTNASGACLGA